VEIVFKNGVGYDSAKLIESVRGMVGLRWRWKAGTCRTAFGNWDKVQMLWRSWLPLIRCSLGR